MKDDLIKIHKHFKYLLKTIDEQDLEIDFNNIIEDIYDEKIDKFIKCTLATYPHYYDNVIEKKDSNVRGATDRKDSKLRKEFLKEIKFSISKAADTLLEKDILNNYNDKIISDINFMISKSISKKNLENDIKSDINQFLPGIKINIQKFSEYLRNEILLRIEDNYLKYDIDAEKELNLLKNQEKEFLYEELYNIVKNNESAEEFWDNY